MILARSLFMLGFVSYLVSCKSTSPSQVMHDFGRFSNSRSASQWLVSDDEGMLKASETLSGEVIFLPASEPMSIRLQAWADAMRKTMIEVDPKIAEVPRPLIRIVKRSGANGFAMPGPVCVDLPLFRDPKSSKTGVFVADTPMNVQATEVQENCFHHPGSPEEKLAFANASFPDHPQCKISKRNGIFILSDECPLAEKTPSDGVTLTAYANRIYLFSGTMAKTEAELVGTIAHELGHYYMAHSRVLPGVYGYFYDETASNHGKPVPLPESDPRRQMGQDLLNFRDIVPKSIKGEIYENYVTRAFVTALQDQGFTAQNCNEGRVCQKECSEISSALSSDTDLYSLLSPVSDDDRLKYLALQKSLKACFSLIPAAGYVDSINDNLSMTLSYSTPPLEINGQVSLHEFMLQSDKTIREFIASANARFVKAEAAFKKAPLGYYTHEQEADEFSTEISLRLGFDGYNQANSQLNNMDPDERAKCKEKMANGFTTPESILDYTNNHHEQCYRVYNIYRELNKVHSEQTKSLEKKEIPKMPPDMSWADLVEKMNKTLGTTP